MADKTIFCGSCGEQLPAGSKFCTKCGAPIPDHLRNMVDEGDEAFADTSAQEDFAQEEEWDAGDVREADAGEKKGSRGFKSMLKWIILAAAIVVAVIILVIVLISPGSIRLDQYISFESSGVNGYGTVTASFDKDAFFDDCAADMLYFECIDWNLEFPDAGNGSLSNGDEAILIWDCDDKAAKQSYGSKLKYSNLTYEVTGLEEMGTVDVFDYVDVILTGADPVGEAYIEVNSNDIGLTTWDFTLSRTEGLRNGDTVTVTLTGDAGAYLAEEFGVSPEFSEKDYAISGMPAYITRVAEIPYETLTELWKISEDVILSDGPADFMEGVTISGLQYEGCYLVYADPAEAEDYFSTELYVVYKVGVSEIVTEFNVNDSFSYYTYLKFNNLILMPDGSCSFNPDDYNMCRDSFSIRYGDDPYQSGTFYGFASTLDLKSAIIDDSYMLYDTDVAATADSNLPGDVERSGDSVVIEGSDASTGGDYLCSYSSDRLITDADLAALRQGNYGTFPGNRSIEQMVVNEIYAKNGYQFTDQEVQQYFEQKAWYNAIGSYSNDMEVIKGRMNPIENQNVENLSKYLD